MLDKLMAQAKRVADMKKLANPLAIINKAQAGELPIEELTEYLEFLGMHAGFDFVQPGREVEAFGDLSDLTGINESRLIRVNLRMKDGTVFNGLLVVNRAN